MARGRACGCCSICCGALSIDPEALALCVCVGSCVSCLRRTPEGRWNDQSVGNCLLHFLT